MLETHVTCQYREPTLEEVLAALKRLFPGKVVDAYTQYESPCPVCFGEDRLSVQKRDASIYCRYCKPDGADRKPKYIDILIALDLYKLPLKESDQQKSSEKFERRSASPRKSSEKIERRSEEERKGAAKRLWNGISVISINGTLAHKWLQSRGIHVTSESIRFVPKAYLPEQNCKSPCMLTKVESSITGEFCAVLRTFFSVVPVKKKFIGSINGGGMRLSGSLDAKTIIVAEGVENAMSFLEAGAKHAIWATGGAGNMAKFIVPPAVEFLIIAADRDPVKEGEEMGEGEKAARALSERAKMQNTSLKGTIIMPPEGMGDWNDMLLKRKHELISWVSALNRRGSMK